MTEPRRIRDARRECEEYGAFHGIEIRRAGPPRPAARPASGHCARSLQGASGAQHPDPHHAAAALRARARARSEEHTSELQSPCNLVCRLLLEKKKRSKQPDRCQPTPEYWWNATPAPPMEGPLP